MMYLDVIQSYKVKISEGYTMITKEQFQKIAKENEEYAPGWEAIETVFSQLYPQQEPEHFGTVLTSRASFGGNQYLDGYSIYTSPKGYKHIVTFGMSELYANEEAFGGEWSGWGYEMTMKLQYPPLKNVSGH